MSGREPSKPSKVAAISPSLQNFDLLPDAAYLRPRDVASLRDCSLASVWRDVKAERLPKPHKLGPNRTGFNVGELRRHRPAREAA